MGKSVTPKYRLQAVTENGAKHTFIWKGKPTKKSITKFLIDMNVSMLPGGCNAHLAEHGLTVRYIHGWVEHNVSQPSYKIAEAVL